MKAAFFTDTYLPNVDGVVTSIVNTRGYLEKHGHEVYVFTAGSQSDKALNTDPDVFFFRSIALPQYPQYKLALFPYLSATQAAKKHPIDLVHCHAITSMGLAAKHVASQLDKPLVGTFHTMITDAGQYLTKNEWVKKGASKVLWRGISLFYKNFDAVTAPSNATASLLEEHGVKNVHVVPNGINLCKYSPDLDKKTVRNLLGIEDGEAMVLVAGRLGFEKNVDVVVKAAKLVLKNRRARFVVTGDGPARGYCEQLAAKEGVAGAFDFEGFVNAKALPHYYAAADCLVSASAFETQGLSLLEAMACGTPVVGADALAIPEAVENGSNGFLFEPFNESDCAEKVLKLLAAPEGRKKAMAKAARAKAESCSIEKSCEKLLKIYREVT